MSPLHEWINAVYYHDTPKLKEYCQEYTAFTGQVYSPDTCRGDLGWAHDFVTIFAFLFVYFVVDMIFKIKRGVFDG